MRTEKPIRLKPLEPNLRQMGRGKEPTGMLGSEVYGFVDALNPLFLRGNLTVGSFFRALDKYQVRHKDSAFALDDVYRAAVNLGRYRLAVKLVNIVVPSIKAAASFCPKECSKDIDKTCWEIIDDSNKYRSTFI